VSSNNRELFEQIQETLEGFQAHSVTLSDVIERVPSLVKEINVDAPWRDEFVGYWWTLEQVHEEAIEIGESRRLPVERRQAVDEAIIRMQTMIDGVLTSA
jgi:hypothetical protein